MDQEERDRLLARFDRELEDFAQGRRDEFRTSDGTRYRRLLEPDGAVFERVSMEVARVQVPFTVEMRDFLLEPRCVRTEIGSRMPGT